MNCLYCGDCCLRMSPKNYSRCLNIIQIDDFYFCKDYENRPFECRNHSFMFNHCPIGIDVCKIQTLDQLRIRIDHGWELIKGLIPMKLTGEFKIVCDKTNNSEQDVKENKLNVDVYLGIEKEKVNNDGYKENKC